MSRALNQFKRIVITLEDVSEPGRTTLSFSIEATRLDGKSTIGSEELEAAEIARRSLDGVLRPQVRP